MTPAEAVGDVLTLLRGGDLKLGDNAVRLVGGGILDVSMEEVNARDIKLRFTGRKPVVNHYGVNLVLNGLTLCVKGIKVDARLLPDTFDPFYPWEALGL